MNDEDLARRISRFSSRPTIADMPMELREELLEEAVACFEGYTNTADPGMPADSVIVSLAVVAANRIGAEGSTKSGEGDIDRMYTEDIPADIRRILNGYRRPVGV